MRMWNVPANLLCNQHLLGEHVELHMFVGTIGKGISVTGYIDKGLLEFDNLFNRHKELVSEMGKRGMNHKSHLPKITKRRPKYCGRIDSIKNALELSRRCPECKARILGEK